MTHQKAITDTPCIALRRVTMVNRPALEEMKERSMATLLDPLLTPDQRDEMRRITPFVPLLIEGGTCYVVTIDGRMAASGGWSRRSALHGAGGTTTAAVRMLDPAVDPAGVRAMYTHPDSAWRGLGSLLLASALSAARLAGFGRAQLLAALAGERLYRAAGWKTEERVMVGTGGRALVPGVRMARTL